MPEYEEGELLFQFPKRRKEKEREVRVSPDVLWALTTKHKGTSEEILQQICEGVLRLSKGGTDSGDSLAELQSSLPTIDPELVREVVKSIMDFPPESNLGKRERDPSNPYALLEETETDPATLSELTQASPETSMITTPKKGSAEEIQFINKTD